MEKKQKSRYLLNRGRVCDMHCRPIALDKLQKSGIESKNLLYADVVEIMGGYNPLVMSRVARLTNGQFLRKEKIPSELKKELGITNPSTKYFYRFGKTSKDYLRQYGNFLNPNGWLMRKNLDNIDAKEEPKPKTIEKTTHTNTKTKDKIHEEEDSKVGW